MRNKLPVGFVTFLLAGGLSAQAPTDAWYVSAIANFVGVGDGGLWEIDPGRSTATLLTGLAPLGTNTKGANCVAVDEAGLVYYGTTQMSSIAIPNPGEVFQLLLSAGQILVETPMTTGPIDSGSVSGIAVRGDQLWFVTDAGSVGWVPIVAPGNPAGAPTIVLNLGSFAVQGLGQSIATNGREIFVGTSVAAGNTDPAQVWMLDAEDPNPTLVPICLLNGSAFALSLGRDGHVIAGRVGGQLWEVDPATGMATQLTGSAPQSNANGTAMNPWLNIIGNVGGYGSTVRQIDFYDLWTGQWQTSPPAPTFTNNGNPIPSGVASAHENPFFLFGKGCPGVLGEPRLGWTGLPQQGSAFDLTLRAADGPVAFLALGLSDSMFPGLGPLPFDVTAFGAPGCAAFVSHDLGALLTVVSASGAANHTLTMPTNPALAGLHLFAQWGAVSTANALRLVLSDAVRIRMR